MRAFPVGTLHAVLVLAGVDGTTAPPPPAENLTPGVTVTRELAASESHAFTLHLAAETRWRVVVEQLGIDVALELTSPAGETDVVDGPLARRGPEWLVLPAGAPGAWRLVVRGPTTGAGSARYGIRLDDVSGASPDEAARLEAELALTRAGRLNRQGSPEARRAAIAACQEALELWRRLRARREEGLTLDSIAALHVLLGEWREAEAAFSASLVVWEELHDTLREAHALNELGLAAWSVGDVPLARQRLQRALERRAALGLVFERAETLSNLGLTYHDAGELEAALAHYQRALPLALEARESLQQANLLNNIGGVYYLQGEPDLALEHYDRALETYTRLGDRQGQADALNNSAVVHRNVGAAQEALLRYARVLELARAASDTRAEARALSNLGYAYSFLGEAERALTFYEQALPLRRGRDRRGEAATLTQLASTYLALGQPARAAELAGEAAALSAELRSGLHQAAALTEQARALTELSRGDDALRLLDAAQALARDAGARLHEAAARQRRGEVLAGRGEAAAAHAALLEALELHRATRNEEQQAVTLYHLARAQRDMGSPQAAFERVREAIALFERLRTRVLSPELRSSYFGARASAYELQVDLLMALHRAEPGAGHARAALEASEAARSRTLLDLLGEAAADLAGSAVPALAEERKVLLRRLSAKAARRQELVARAREDQQIAVLERDLDLARTELDRLEAEIRRRDARYASLTQPPRPDAARIQALLDDETLLLEYALGAERSWLWLASRDAVHAFELAPRQEIEDAARAAHAALSQRELHRDADDAPLARLARLVLGPVAGRLGHARLLVVGDGALHYVPFAALPVPGAGREPLVVRHEVVSLPSIGGLLALRQENQRRPPPERAVVVFADPVFDADDPRLRGGARQAAADARTAQNAERDWPAALGRLGATRREAEAIARLVPASRAVLAVGFDANRTAVLGGALPPARILHFATHGVLDTSQPELSGLVLSRFGADGAARDGFLRLHDVYALRLPYELVVLSGCQTALGREVRGEGLVGLTRGFMYAGVPRVAASLWRVQDRATAELMSRFYGGMLHEGLAPAAALRRAQMSLRAERRWADPYYWAGFVLQGDWR